MNSFCNTVFVIVMQIKLVVVVGTVDVVRHTLRSIIAKTRVSAVTTIS